MLTHIAIKDFAIVADLALDLRSGMTVLTGETGAGKSILIDALQYALGARADATMVRHGCERADITVSFSLVTIPQAKTWLQEHELSADDECILRRTISNDGRSKHFINGQLCTQAQVRELSELLVNIHGQHENQRLLQRDQQQQLLDEFAHADSLVKPLNQQKIFDKFAHHNELVKQVQTLYQQWQQTQAKITALQKKDGNDAHVALLKFQVEELANLNLQAGEDALLTAEHKQLANADTLTLQCQQALDLLQSNEAGNACDLLATALKQLTHLQTLDGRLKNIVTLLNDANIQAQEAASELQRYSEQVDVDPERLSVVENRLRVLHDSARKYKVTVNELPQLEQRLQEELIAMEHVDKHIAELEKQLELLAKQYQTAAASLSKSRQQAAERFNKLVSAHIKELGMPEGQFSLQFEPQEKFSPQGLEKIEFLVSANRGQPPKPLNKVASGGEISRISLAIQVITAQADNTPTLIFDEVDVGIGGGTAEMVGKILNQLSKKAQVLCITHQPQVAAQGTHHLQITKATKGDQTVSKIIELKDADRINEIARMLGGIKITKQTLAHAKEMLGA